MPTFSAVQAMVVKSDSPLIINEFRSVKITLALSSTSGILMFTITSIFFLISAAIVSSDLFLQLIPSDKLGTQNLVILYTNTELRNSAS